MIPVSQMRTMRYKWAGNLPKVTQLKRGVLAFNYTSSHVSSLNTLWKYDESYGSSPWKCTCLYTQPHNFTMHRCTHLQSHVSRDDRPQGPPTPRPTSLQNLGMVLLLGLRVSCKDGRLGVPLLRVHRSPTLCQTQTPESCFPVSPAHSQLESSGRWKAALFFSLSFRPLYVHRPTPPLSSPRLFYWNCLLLK